MKRQTFLTIAAIVALLFAAFMFAAPDKMMESQGISPDDLVKVMLQFMSIMMFSIAVITFLSRKDPGSIALRAVLTGSTVMHILSMSIDWLGYARGIFPKVSGIMPGTIVHLIFAIGFIYYLVKLPRQK